MNKAQINARKKKLMEQLQHACETNNPHLAAKMLIELAQIEWPQHPYPNLRDIAERVKNGAAQIRQLDQVLYSADSAQWQGKPLCQAVQRGLFLSQQQSPAQDSNRIEDLYPSHAS